MNKMKSNIYVKTKEGIFSCSSQTELEQRFLHKMPNYEALLKRKPFPINMANVIDT